MLSSAFWYNTSIRVTDGRTDEQRVIAYMRYAHALRLRRA